MNYVFPELATYKREWIPLLEAAREWVERRRCAYVCHALDFAAKEYEGNRYSAAAKEVKDLIASAIEGYDTVIEWYPATHCVMPSTQRAYRLAWLDHIIARCEA